MTDGKWWDQAWQIVEGCTPVSAGCDHCWARGMQRRFPKTLGNPGTVRFRADRLDAPRHWLKRRRVGVWCDLFHEDICQCDIIAALSMMRSAEQHRFVVLTKRMARAARKLRLIGARPLHNVWLGTSAENQATFDERAPYLAQLAAAGWHTVLSCEPLLGPIDLGRIVWFKPGFSPPDFQASAMGRMHLSWLIAGGETGPGARWAHPDWFRSLRCQCVAAGAPFWLKSMGKGLGRELDGRTWDELPVGMEVDHATGG